MKVTPAVLQQELVGLHAEVVESSNSHLLGIKGKVIDETRNLLIILHKNKKKAVVKDTAVFHFKLSDGTIVKINGETLVGRPEQRVKRRIRRLW